MCVCDRLGVLEEGFGGGQTDRRQTDSKTG